MNDLENNRLKINEIDKKIAELFEQRMYAASQIALYKKENNIPVFDSSREQEILKNEVEYIKNEELKEYYLTFIQDLMNISKEYQKKILKSENLGEKNQTNTPSEPSSISLNLKENSYNVFFKPGLLQNVSDFLNLNRRVLIVTDDGVPFSYAQTLASQCKLPVIFTIQHGENNKNLSTVQSLINEMLKNHFTRKDCVVAVGGGIVGDLAGFTAASYMRGIDFYNIPTTVLSCVDSSVGGKTGVNFENVKNIVGAFWQPKCVLIDTDLLKSLPERQISNGLAEALKMSITFDEDLFNLFENENPFEHIEKIIYRSIQLKAKVVEKDEKESGLRKVLNFGHTIGHGIESTCLDGTLLHGECVGLGMIPMVSSEIRPRVIKCLKKLNLPCSYNFNTDKVIEAISHDKKSSENSISTVFCPEIGKFELRDLSIIQIREMLSSIK